MQVFAQKKEVLHRKTLLLAEEFKDEIPEKFIFRLEDIMLDFVSDMNEVAKNNDSKVDRSEIKELLIEIREGFKRMDERFEQVDKRFESMQIQMDERFEQVDKRFESMQIQMDKRFEQVDKRFNAMQWLIGLGFVVLGILISISQIFNQ